MWKTPLRAIPPSSLSLSTLPFAERGDLSLVSIWLGRVAVYSIQTAGDWPVR